MMLSPAFATTMAYDTSGNPYQMAYPANTPVYPSAVPVAANDSRPFEMIPHRIFVGGFPAATTELDLRTFFEQFGHVREAKVIRSSEGTSKGYGFITFDSEEEAKAVMQISANQDADKLEFKGRRLNLGPAIRRMIHGPRYSPGFAEYTIATPTGQLLTTTALGGLTYAYPQSSFVMVSPNQMQSLVYSPMSPAQFTFTNSEGTNNRVQQPTNNATTLMVMPNSANNITPHDSPRTNTFGEQQQTIASAVQITAGVAQPHQYCLAPNGMQQVTQITQPLTPMTPSVTTQRAAIYTQNAFFSPSSAPPNDMTHYSQMTAPTYFYTPSAFSAIDASVQPPQTMTITTPTPVSQIVHQPLTPQTPQHCYYDEGALSGWQNSADVRQTSTPRRSPMKSIISLSSRLAQVTLQQYDRKECQQSTAQGGATSSSKQFNVLNCLILL